MKKEVNRAATCKKLWETDTIRKNGYEVVNWIEMTKYIFHWYAIPLELAEVLAEMGATVVYGSNNCWYGTIEQYKNVFNDPYLRKLLSQYQKKGKYH